MTKPPRTTTPTPIITPAELKVTTKVVAQATDGASITDEQLVAYRVGKEHLKGFSDDQIREVMILDDEWGKDEVVKTTLDPQREPTEPSLPVATPQEDEDDLKTEVEKDQADETSLPTEISDEELERHKRDIKAMLALSDFALLDDLYERGVLVPEPLDDAQQHVRHRFNLFLELSPEAQRELLLAGEDAIFDFDTFKKEYGQKMAAELAVRKQREAEVEKLRVERAAKQAEEREAQKAAQQEAYRLQQQREAEEKAKDEATALAAKQAREDEDQKAKEYAEKKALAEAEKDGKPSSSYWKWKFSDVRRGFWFLLAAVLLLMAVLLFQTFRDRGDTTVTQNVTTTSPPTPEKVTASVPPVVASPAPTQVLAVDPVARAGAAEAIIVANNAAQAALAQKKDNDNVQAPATVVSTTNVRTQAPSCNECVNSMVDRLTQPENPTAKLIEEELLTMEQLHKNAVYACGRLGCLNTSETPTQTGSDTTTSPTYGVVVQ